jgi:hypothetical protein
MMLGPPHGGADANLTGTVGAAFDFGAVLLVICVVLLMLFQRITSPAAPTRREAVSSGGPDQG